MTIYSEQLESMKRRVYAAWAHEARMAERDDFVDDGVNTFVDASDEELESIWGWSDDDIILLGEALASIRQDKANHEEDRRLS